MTRSIRNVLITAALLGPAALTTSFDATIAHAADDHDHAPGISLGTVKIGNYEVEALQSGKIEVGKESVFELKLKGAPEPTAIRAWIGIESGRGSVKAKSHKHGDETSIHCEAPDPIPADAKLWIELETAEGKVKGSLTLKRS